MAEGPEYTDLYDLVLTYKERSALLSPLDCEELAYWCRNASSLSHLEIVLEEILPPFFQKKTIGGNDPSLRRLRRAVLRRLRDHATIKGEVH